MKESFELSLTLHGTSEKLYKAWLDSNEHGNFTGSEAHIDPVVNGRFTAWDEYITGTNIALEPYRRIVQAWRTSEFGQNNEDSVVEITFEDKGAQTRLTLKHSNIPEGQGEDYKKGWQDFYFKPMKKYFSPWKKN